MLNKLIQKLSNPAVIIYCTVFALILTLPSLFVDWQFDDHYQRMVLLELPQSEIKPIELFTVFTGDPEINFQYMDMGLLPWWTTPD